MLWSVISYYIVAGYGVAGAIYYIVAGGVTSCSGGVAGVVELLELQVLQVLESLVMFWMHF